MRLTETAASLVQLTGRLRGVGAVARRLHRRFVLSTAEWTLRMRGGYRMVLPVASGQTWTAATQGRYGEEATDLLAPHIRPGTVVLDIGASLGLFTVPAALAARRNNARVVAFEPVPLNVAYIRRNLEMNKLTDVVTLRPIGLGSSAGQLEMRVEGVGAGNASATVGIAPKEMERHAALGGLAANTVRVPIARLDDEDLPSCSAIKIDVEGLELDVLSGAEKLIDRDRPVIFGEFSPGWLVSRGVPVDAPYRWALAHGYAMFGFPAHRGRPWLAIRPGEAVRVTGPWTGGDVLLVPDERAQDLPR